MSILSIKLLLLRRENYMLKKKILKMKRGKTITDMKRIKKLNKDKDKNKDKNLPSSVKKKKLSPIMQDIVNNANVNPHARDYCHQSKLFSWALFQMSPEAYKFASNVIPLPCETNLRKSFSSSYNQRKIDLTTIENVTKILDINKPVEPCKPIDCVLCVDAFSATVLMKKEQKFKEKVKDDDVGGDETKDNWNNVFLFLMCPIECNIKPFILQIKPHKNGRASKEIFDIIDSIIEQTKQTSFNIKYVACDGDGAYSQFFDNQFNDLYKAIKTNSLIQYFNDKGFVFWLSDPLHLWKNSRTKLLFNKIVPNPLVESGSISADKLNQILELGPSLNDLSSIGKMRDIFAIDIFNFNNASELFKNGLYGDFIFIFIHALWTEAILNTFIKPDTRKCLLTMLLHILIRLYDIQEEIILPYNIHFKKSKNTEFVTMFTQKKLRRWISTVSATIYEIETGNLNTALERIGNHCIEQQIGRIRVICKYDHRIEQIIHATASISFIKEITKILFPLKAKRNRLNNGGCHLSDGQIDILPEGDPYEIADLLLGLIGFDTNPPEDFIQYFNDYLANFIENAPLSIASLPSRCSNQSIIDRYYSQKDYNPQFKKIKWEEKDKIIFDQYILNKQEDQIYQVYKHVPKDSIKNFIRARKDLLAYRPIERSEIFFIDKHIRENYPLKTILPFLNARTLKSLKSMVNSRKMVLNIH